MAGLGKGSKEGINGEPTRTYKIPLWEVNHSAERLKMEQKSNWVAYKLGYEMQADVSDPDGLAYPMFKSEMFPDGNISKVDYDPRRRVAICMDFNRKLQTCVLAQYKDGRYIAFDEVATEDATTPTQGINVANKLMSWGIDHVYLYGDNTSNQKAGRYGRTGKNDWEYIKEALREAKITFTSKLRLQNPRRDVRVEKVNATMHNELTGQRNILIHERCQTLIKDYEKAETNNDGTKIDSGLIGHISDAFDYYVFEHSKSAGGPMYVQ